jgi:hypothetical protein
MERDNQTLASGREVNYECDSSDKCNGPIQKLLSSVSVEDQYQQEIARLLKIVSSFDARAADYLYFHNTTFRCLPPDLRRRHRCTVEVDQQTSLSESRDNYVERCNAFVLSNRTEDIDIAVLGCRLRGCNSTDNANIVYKASKITFNADEYFKK